MPRIISKNAPWILVATAGESTPAVSRDTPAPMIASPSPQSQGLRPFFLGNNAAAAGSSSTAAAVLPSPRFSGRRFRHSTSGTAKATNTAKSSTRHQNSTAPHRAPVRHPCSAAQAPKTRSTTGMVQLCRAVGQQAPLHPAAALTAKARNKI